MNVLKDMYAEVSIESISSVCIFFLSTVRQGDDETRRAIEESWKERIVDKGLDKDFQFYCRQPLSTLAAISISVNPTGHGAYIYFTTTMSLLKTKQLS